MTTTTYGRAVEPHISTELDWHPAEYQPDLGRVL